MRELALISASVVHQPCIQPIKCMILYFVHSAWKCHVCSESPDPRVPHLELMA